MVKNYINLVFDAPIPSPTDKLVALAIAKFANRETGVAWPSVETLRKMTALSERTVRISIRRLEKQGFMTTRINYSGGKGKPSVYHLHLEGPDSLKGASAAAKGAFDTIKGASNAAMGAANAPELIGTKEGNKKVKHESFSPFQNSLERRPNLEEVVAFAKSLGLPSRLGRGLFYGFEESGWMVGDEPIRSWKALILNGLKSGYYEELIARLAELEKGSEN